MRVRRHPGPWLVFLLALAAVGGVILVAKIRDPGYESQEEAAKRLGQRVDCQVLRGPRVAPYRGSLASVNAVTKRIVRREAEKPGTTLHRIIDGRSYDLRTPVPTTYAAGNSERISGGSWTVLFEKPVKVDATVLQTGLPPTGTGERYIRRLGYFTYKVRVKGTMRALGVEADARANRVVAISENLADPDSKPFDSFEEIPGTCPLQDVSHNTGA